MEKIISALNELQQINAAYGIPSDDIQQLKNEINIAKVCTPIIGKFSSGKSALINTLLGYTRKILKEDITPETAVPAEIVYSDSEDRITVANNDNTYKELTVAEYREFDADASNVKKVIIRLRNSSLEKFPDVMLVDMPGFESGYEIHNKVIDNYLPQSLAYIIAFPADDMIVRSSVGNILKELCLHEMPLCVVITKFDKRNDEYDITYAKLKQDLKRYVGDREIKYCITSSFTGDAQELELFLQEIQGRSEDLLYDKYKKNVLVIAENTENYFKTMLNNSRLSESELDEQEERLRRQLSSLESEFSDEQNDFEQEISECIEQIKVDVQHALEAEESTLVAMAMNNQNINERINTIVRSAVTVSIQKHFIPKVEQYLKKAAKTISSASIGDVHISLMIDTKDLNKSIMPTIVAIAAGILLEIPILGIIAGILLKLRSDKKREEAKEKIRVKIREEVFPQVIREVGEGIETAIEKQVLKVNSSIEKEFSNQKATLEKTIDDIRIRIKDEKTDKDNFEKDIKENLARIGEIKNVL